MKNSNQLPTVFSYEDKTITVVKENAMPWFKGLDVCAALGIANSKDVIRKRLDEDEKRRLKVAPSGQSPWFVNESGLYALIMRSNKPEAKKFRKWVTSEVLPAIRKTGRYEKPEPGNVAAGYIDEAIKVAGSMRSLAGRIGVSPASLSQIKKRPHLFDGAYIGQVITACSRVVKRRGSVDVDSMEMLMQVEDKDIRLGLWNKMRKGGLL